jgi:hypothetical protein
MKTFKIEVPNGYEIDKVKSTFENIVFKEVKKELPKKWEDLEIDNGYYVTDDSEIKGGDGEFSSVNENKNTFATKEQAEASIALAQLSQLREVYRNGWKPDWTDNNGKFTIFVNDNEIKKEVFRNVSVFLSFKDEETRDLFFENFHKLIEIAKPLMS